MEHKVNERIEIFLPLLQTLTDVKLLMDGTLGADITPLKPFHTDYIGKTT